MLRNLAQYVDGAMTEDKFYGIIYNEIKEQYLEAKDEKLPELAFDYFKIITFTYLTKSTYLIGY